jgi:uncharacterized protein (TIGR03083 family)
MTESVAAFDALDQEAAALSAVIRTLAPADLAASTNCPPWTLHELIVHIADSIRVDDRPLPDAPPHDRPRTAADYYRRPERDTDAYRQRNVEHAQTSAAAVPDASARFDAEAAHTLDVLRRDDAARVVPIPRIGPMVLAEWTVTRVIAVAAHALDVAITLNRPPWTTDAALRVTRPVLIDLLGARPPDSPRWTGHGFLAVATGRRPISDSDRYELGELADRFPLLS